MSPFSHPATIRLPSKYFLNTRCSASAGIHFGRVFLSLAGLRYWRRCGELSADRCAAAVVGEKVFQMQMLKLTCGLGEVHGSPYQLVEQAREYESLQNASWWNRIQQKMRIMFYTHPQMCHRALEIDRWKKSWQYRQLQHA